MRLGIDESNRTVTALPLLLPNYMPNQNGLPSLLAGLANILQQPGGAQDVEGIAEVCNVLILHVRWCNLAFNSGHTASDRYVYSSSLCA